MIVNEFSVQGERFRLKYTENGKILQMTGDYYPFYKEYVRYGYESQVAFVIAVCEGREDVQQLINKFNRAQGYKKKIAYERLAELEKILRAQGHIKDKEIKALAYDQYCKETDKWHVNWKRLNELSDIEVKKLRKKRAMTRADFIDALKDTNLKGAEMKNLRMASIRFKFDMFGLSKSAWSKCPFIKGHTAKIKDGKVLSFNHKSKQGYAFDLFDLSNTLYNLPTAKCLKYMACHVWDFELWHNEVQRYDKAIKRIGYLQQRADYPYMNKLLKEVWDFFKMLLEKGREQIATDYFIDDRAVFFRSLGYLQEDMVKLSNKDTIKRIADRINLLSAVGLLEKVKMEELPEHMQYENLQPYDCNYFILPKWDIREIEKRSKVLIDHNIRIGNINRKSLTQALGSDVAYKVFNDMKEEIVILNHLPF